MPPQLESSQHGRSLVTLNNKLCLRARRALKGYLSLNNSIVFLFMLKRLQVAVPDGTQLISGANMLNREHFKRWELRSSNLWNKILPISDTFHQRQLTVISDNAEPLVYVFTLETSIPPFFVAINFVILPFLVTSASGELWWLISFVMMRWPYLASHLAECDEEAGDLVNSLEDVVRDF